ncbi:MAG: glycosyltransferase [Verrucomicrobiota bacterium]
MNHVSVCIPVYNGAAHLADCLRSVATQEPVGLEIVVGDDNSSDRSLDIVTAAREQFPALDWKILRHPDRLGMAGNWNACVEAASGPLIKVMGQDDILYPGCLATQAESLTASDEIALCACGCEICSASGKKIFHRKRKRTRGIHDGNEIVSDCLRTAANLVGEPVTTMFRKSDFQKAGGFDLSMRYYIDVDMWARLLNGRKFTFIDRPLCGFRIHRGGASFSLQGEGYAEFLRMEKKLSFSRPLPPPVRLLRRISALRDSCLRLVAYRFLGSL